MNSYNWKRSSEGITRSACPTDIFFLVVSRLCNDQSSYDVKVYIQNKIQDTDIQVEKFNFKYPREISSFKIACSEKSFDLICLKSVWPEHIYVSQYNEKKRSDTDRW